MMNRRELKKLKKQLPDGYREKIAKRSGFSVSYVDKVLGGQRKCQEILDVAFELLREEKQRIQERKDLLNQ